MPRAAATSDIFNAIAAPRRREILTYLALGEQSVGAIAGALGLAQPSVSKHLRVLRNVDLVSSRRIGRERLYQTNTASIRPLHDRAATFEGYWQHQLPRVKEIAEDKDRQGAGRRTTSRRGLPRVGLRGSRCN